MESWNLKEIDPKSEYVFFRDGKPISKMQVNRAFRKACELAEISDFRFHDLRHCFASWHKQAGIKIETLADLLGHSDTRMTLRYAHIGQVDLANATEKLENFYLRS
ncbi:MAG: site-specific integrase [Nitrospiria bacterium]